MDKSYMIIDFLLFLPLIIIIYDPFEILDNTLVSLFK